MQVKLQSKHVDEADIRLMCETMRGNTSLLTCFIHYTTVTQLLQHRLESPGVDRKYLTNTNSL